MKKWTIPAVEELSLSATAYSQLRTSKVDGTYNSNDGKFTNDTYGVSGSNNGEPKVVYNNGEPTAVVK